MFRWIVLVLIVVPALEIWVLIEMGRLIGGWQTFLLVLLTGLLGAFLARKEAQRVLHYARYELSQGTIPTASILDGICIFAGGLLLLAPGFLTDCIGLVLLLPFTRILCKKWLYHVIRRKIADGNIQFYWRR